MRTKPSPLPLLDQLRSYDRSWLPADIGAALTVWAIVVPESMAYASIAGMPPVTGLYASSIPLLVYALLGTSRRVTYGPTASVAALSLATVGPLAGGDPERFIAMSAALALIVGGLLAVAGLARLGVIAEFLSAPVLIGYLTGVALTIMLGQVDKILEVELTGDGFFEELWSAVTGFDEANLSSLAVGAGAYLALVVLHKVLPMIPSALIVAIAAIIASAAFDWESTMHVVGDIPAGFPALTIPRISLSELSSLTVGAVGVAIIIYGESTALAKSFGKPHGEKVDGNRELIALGVANASGGLFGSFVTSTSNSRSAASNAAGQETQVSSLIVGAAVLVTAAFITPLFRTLPEAVLGAIVIHAVIRLVRVRPLRVLWGKNRTDFTAAAATLLGVLVFGVLAGLMVGILVSIGTLMARAANPHVARLALDPRTDRYRDIERIRKDVEPIELEGITILRFDASLFFANANALVDAVERAVEVDRPRAVILEAEAFTEVDTTAAEAIEGLLATLDRQGIEFAFARLTEKPAEDLARCGVDVSEMRYRRVADAVEALAQ